MLRILIAATSAVAILTALAACGGGSDPQSDAIRAVAESDLFIGGVRGSLLLGESDCGIPHGGPPRVDPDDEGALDGLCIWEAERDGDDWLVTFSESWSAPDYPHTHAWTYRVGSAASVTLIDESGPIPPQLWE